LETAGQLRKDISHLGCLHLTPTAAVGRASRGELAQPQITVEMKKVPRQPGATVDEAPAILVRLGHDIGNGYY
jgi:hypothetical protein